MKFNFSLTTVLVVAALLITGCQSYNPEEPIESLEHLIDVVHSETDVECTVPPANELKHEPDSIAGFNGTQCANDGALYYFYNESTKVGILRDHNKADISESKLALGDNWLVRTTSENAANVREVLAGSQPNLVLYPPTTPAVTPTPESTPEASGFTISCSNEEFTSFDEAWEELAPNERATCIAKWTHEDQEEAAELHEYSETELEALEIAGLENEELSDLYRNCAAKELGKSEEAYHWRDEAAYYGGDSDQAEVDGAFILCPDHPERDVVEQGMKEAATEVDQVERGERFGAGLYQVNEDIQPGTYVSEDEEGFEGCYWERLDSAGNIINNNFITSGFRAEVTIQDSDYSFFTERCGEWAKQ